MSELTTKTFAIAEVKSIDGESANGEFEVILSTDVKDRDGEVVDFGAFEPLPASIPIHVLHKFSSDLPVARAVPVYEDGRLKGRGFYASTPEAQTVRTLVREGIVDSVSVGFMRGERETKDGVPHITKASLLEASFVGVPANPEAAVLLAKGLKDDTFSEDEVREMEGLQRLGAEDRADALKAGARNSAPDQQRIQDMHDSAVALGATCATKAADPEETKSPSDAEDSEEDVAQMALKARALRLLAHTP